MLGQVMKPINDAPQEAEAKQATWCPPKCLLFLKQGSDRSWDVGKILGTSEKSWSVRKTLHLAEKEGSHRSRSYLQTIGVNWCTL